MMSQTHTPRHTPYISYIQKRNHKLCSKKVTISISTQIKWVYTNILFYLSYLCETIYLSFASKKKTEMKRKEK